MNNYEKRVNLKLMTARMYSIKISLKLQQQTEQCPKKRTNNRHHFFFNLIFYSAVFVTQTEFSCSHRPRTSEKSIPQTALPKTTFEHNNK